jgi:DMSO reductase anchor subunit
MATPLGRDTLPWWLFLSAAFVAAGASTMHLGRPSRAWRAVLGWRTSWLSREILFFNAFTVVGTLELLGVLPGWVEVLGAGPDTAARATGAAVALVGFATLFSIDRVYTVTHTPGLPVHSARTVATGLMVSGLVAGVTPLWVGILALKLLSYGARKHREVMSGGVWSRGVSSARVATTLAGAALLAGGTPVSTLLLGPDGGAAFEGGAIVTLLVGVGLLLVGGAIDRAEFYRELRVITPAGRIAEDLRIAATPEG